MPVLLLEVLLLWSNKTPGAVPVYLQHITVYVSLPFYILIIQHIGPYVHRELTS